MSRKLSDESTRPRHASLAVVLQVRDGSLQVLLWERGRNPFRGASHQDPRLVRVMEKHGFTWGGRWPTRPDPMHFELRGSDPLSSPPG